MTLTSDSDLGEELHSDSTSAVSLDSSIFSSETVASCILGDVLVINVGGRRHVLSQELLASHPQTRLGKLARCSGCAAALELCDDADLPENEFFFDRNAQTFQSVVTFYLTGHLHVMEQLCETSFLQEIQYWGMEDVRIARCCRQRFSRRKKPRADVQRELQADNDGDEDFVGVACPTLRQRLWNLLEKPDSSPAAHAVGSLSVLFVVLSVLSMVLVSLDSGEDMGVSAPWLFEALEYACVVWFTGELALRFLCARDKCRFSRSAANVVDLLAVLPFYATLALERGNGELEDMGHVVQVLRLLRSLRMLKLGRHSTGLKSLAVTISQSYEEIGLLLLFLGVAISIFAVVIFWLERDLPSTTFTSLPVAWWWATTSMTTVGYGDVRPDTAVGKVLALVCIVSGILVLALPIAIINDRFSSCYSTIKLREEEARHAHALRRMPRPSFSGGGVNLRDAYARSVLEMMRPHGEGGEGGERVTNSS